MVERIVDFLRNVGTGKKKSLDYLEKVVKGQIKEIQYYSDGHIDAYWWNEPYKKYKKENVK